MKATFSNSTKALLCLYPVSEPVVSDGQYARLLSESEIALLTAGGPFIDTETGIEKTAPAPIRLSRLEFLTRLTEAEKVAILTSADAGAVIFRTMFLAADYIDLGDERMVNGLYYLASLGLITNTRAAALLSA